MKVYGSFVVGLYHKEEFLDNVLIHPSLDHLPFEPGKELRVSNFSVTSDRCPPLVVLHMIAKDGVLFKLEPANVTIESQKLQIMHNMCLTESKSAVITSSGGLEIHLVAMNSRRKFFPCFWGFVLSPRLYKSCLTMFNLRCLALVLDLDETLIVANTLKSFEDRIEALGSKLKGETDGQKTSVMSAELKRYIQDRALLRQYADNDRVWDNTTEKYIRAEIEIVPSSTEGASPLMRPIVRLKDSSMVFTRINPNVRDTSVLVRLRPAWEELREYLIAKGRKRFEVFVCTMAEREYALEVWRLLDPQSQLIKESDVLQRVVCVKSASKKSLANVFVSGNCHPSMAMVIDDRLKVWEDRDQSHVHVVPAFAPYYDPQAEVNIPMPILCVARNVASDVRAGFFRDFDEGLLKEMAGIEYDANVRSLPRRPVLSKYLVGEEEPIQNEFSNGNTQDSGTKFELGNSKKLEEVSQREAVLNQQAQILSTAIIKEPQQYMNRTFANEKLTAHPLIDNSVKAPIMQSQLYLANDSFRSPPFPNPREFPEPELNKDIHNRQLILLHGQDSEHQHKYQGKISPLPVNDTLGFTNSSLSKTTDDQRRSEGEVFPNHLSTAFPGITRPGEHSFYGSQDNPAFTTSKPPNKEISKETYPVDDRQKSENIFSAHMNTSPETHRENPIIILQELADKYNTTVEFKAVVNTTKDLQFSVEVFFDREKVGEGTGGNRKEAQYRAADCALQFMTRSNFFVRYMHMHPHGHGRFTNSRDDTFMSLRRRAPRYFAALTSPAPADHVPFLTPAGRSNLAESQHLLESNREYNPVAALREYCDMEGMSVVFNDLSPVLASLEHHLQGFVCQVEVGGRPMGNGNGWTWEEAKQQAANEALRRVRMDSRHRTPRHSPPHRSPPRPNKRSRTGDLPPRQSMNPSPRRFFNSKRSPDYQPQLYLGFDFLQSFYMGMLELGCEEEIGKFPCTTTTISHYLNSKNVLLTEVISISFMLVTKLLQLTFFYGERLLPQILRHCKPLF